MLKKLAKRVLTREFIAYIIFGVATTVVSLVTFEISRCWLHYAVANVVSWVAAVTFAFFTNKFWVFRTGALRGRAFLREAVLFYSARLFSLAVEELGLWLLVDMLAVKELLAKLVLQVLVVLLNYVLSKLIVFRKKQQ